MSILVIFFIWIVLAIASAYTALLIDDIEKSFWDMFLLGLFWPLILIAGIFPLVCLTALILKRISLHSYGREDD